MSNITATVVEFKADPNYKEPAPDPRAKVCLSCNYVGRGRFPGSPWFYIPLALAWIFPALLFWIYRASSGQCVCLQCGKKTLVPASSAIGKAIIKEEEKARAEERSRRRATEVRVSRNAESAAKYGSPLIESVEEFEAMLFGNCTVSTFTLNKSVDPARSYIELIPPFLMGCGIILDNSFSVRIEHSKEDGGKRVGVRVVQMRPEALKMAKAIVGEGKKS